MKGEEADTVDVEDGVSSIVFDEVEVEESARLG